MLKVLEQYIESESPSTKRYATDSRFAKILASSVVAHLLFYALIIQLDLMRKLDNSPAPRPRTELVMIAEVGPLPSSPPLRAIIEPLERADTRRMEYNPEQANDTDLIARSPRLGNPEGTARNTGSPRPSATSQPAQSGSSAPAQQRSVPAPPATVPIVAQSLPNPSPLPTASLRGPNTSIDSPPATPPGQAPQSQESRGTRSFSLEEINSQYMALVRAKISKANERNMPRDWIRDVLNNGVSADFRITIRRGGRLSTVDLIRSSGYPTLDSAAREAIYNAGPFEGYPQDAGEQITLSVKISFAPVP